MKENSLEGFLEDLIKGCLGNCPEGCTMVWLEYFLKDLLKACPGDSLEGCSKV